MHPGFLILFAQATSWNCNLMGTVISAVTQGHYHVEAVFAWQEGDPSMPGGFRYDVRELPYRFTALPSQPFRLHEIPDDFFTADDAACKWKWDIMFVPIKSTHDRDKAVAWAARHRGVPYNYRRAIMAPMTSVIRRRHDPPPREKADSPALFCSEAVVNMLQIAGAMDHYFDFIVAEKVTPAVLYDIMALEDSRVVKQVPREAVVYTPPLHPQPRPLLSVAHVAKWDWLARLAKPLK